jgi:hypothetical protein
VAGGVPVDGDDDDAAVEVAEPEEGDEDTGLDDGVVDDVEEDAEVDGLTVCE